MEERLPSHRDVERDVWVKLITTRVLLEVLPGRHTQQIPLRAAVEVLQVDAVLDVVQVADSRPLLVHVLEVDLQISTAHTLDNLSI